MTGVNHKLSAAVGIRRGRYRSTILFFSDCLNAKTVPRVCLSVVVVVLVMFFIVLLVMFLVMLFWLRRLMVVMVVTAVEVGVVVVFDAPVAVEGAAGCQAGAAASDCADEQKQ